MLTVVMPIVAFFIVTMKVVIQRAIKSSVVRLIATMPNVVMLSVVAP